MPHLPRSRADATHVDPRVARSRAAVIDAATTLFLRNGYLGTSMDDISAEAGVSKRTVYNNFDDKAGLFRDVVMRAADVAERFAHDAAIELDDPVDLPGALSQLARRLVSDVTSRRVVQLRRLLIGEAHRFPELATEYYRRAPGTVMTTIADAFARLADRGRLQISDPERAAEHFAFLVLGAALDRALFSDLDDPPDPERLVQMADDGVRTFLAAHPAHRA
jgi:TetR/AcrR family transcriptional regulator, mexJK operon transcriptional repressor